LVVGFASPPLSQFKEKGKELTLDPFFSGGLGKTGNVGYFKLSDKRHPHVIQRIPLLLT